MRFKYENRNRARVSLSKDGKFHLLSYLRVCLINHFGFRVIISSLGMAYSVYCK